MTLTAAAVLTVGMTAPADAMPNPGLSDDLFTIHLVIPDPTNPTILCNLSFTPTSSLTFNSTGVATGVATETGRVKVSSSGCASVTWTSVVIVKDESPGHPTRTVIGTGSTSAQATQTVPYAVGVREAGVVTFQMLSSSRLGDFCWEDIWEISALGNPSPVKSSVC